MFKRGMNRNYILGGMALTASLYRLNRIHKDRSDFFHLVQLPIQVNKPLLTIAKTTRPY